MDMLKSTSDNGSCSTIALRELLKARSLEPDNGEGSKQSGYRKGSGVLESKSNRIAKHMVLWAKV
jgi:hypothetical protein